MDWSQVQSEIDAVSWYHEFDFGHGLHSRPGPSISSDHRRLWCFIEQQLDGIDFRNKSVLDIGCWDGYWSFYAERRGARRVVATDDRTQNWSDGNGIHLAKKLLGSAVVINQEMPIYRLESLRERFDIVLCLGVYYHLLDPFLGFAQVRHCCHRESVAVIEGNVAARLPANAALLNFSNHGSEFSPTAGALEQLLRAAYLVAADRKYLENPGWRQMMRKHLPVFSGFLAKVKDSVRRTNSMRRCLLRCSPFEGANEIHFYKPPFGLDAYDSRFRESANEPPSSVEPADECRSDPAPVMGELVVPV